MSLKHPVSEQEEGLNISKSLEENSIISSHRMNQV
jgi:hypothetical protein